MAFFFSFLKEELSYIYIYLEDDHCLNCFHCICLAHMMFYSYAELLLVDFLTIQYLYQNYVQDMPISSFSLFFFGWRRICIASVTWNWEVQARKVQLIGSPFSGVWFSWLYERTLTRDLPSQLKSIYCDCLHLVLFLVRNFQLQLSIIISSPACIVYVGLFQGNIMLADLPICSFQSTSMVPWTLSKPLFGNSKSPIIGEGEQTVPFSFLAN